MNSEEHSIPPEPLAPDPVPSLLDSLPSIPGESRDALVRTVLETTVDGIITIDVQGRIRLFNPAAEKIFGYRAREILGQPVDLLMPVPDRHQHKKYVDRYLETGQARIIGIGREVTGVRRNGKLFPLELAVSEMQLGGERLFTGILRDITERKEVERALEDEQNFVSAILNTVGALVVVLDSQGRIVRFNRSCERITGHAVDRVLGRQFWEILIAEEDRSTWRKRFDTLLAGTRIKDYESHLLTRDGERRRIAWSHTTLQDEQGRVEYVVGTGLDVTKRKQAEEALVSVSEGERRQIGQELHDALGQVMTGITLLSGALERKLARKDVPEQVEASEITKLAQTALGEVRRLSHGLYPAELERHGLSSALQELVDSQRHLHEIRCIFDGIDRGERALDRSTQLHLYRIAQEALNNAVKHGSPREIIITFFNDANLLKLTVEDDGTGIPDGVLANGMGLAIMRYRAVQINADIGIGRRRNGGTRVACVLHHKNP